MAHRDFRMMHPNREVITMRAWLKKTAIALCLLLMWAAASGCQPDTREETRNGQPVEDIGDVRDAEDQGENETGALPRG